MSVANGLRVLRANAAAVSTQMGVGFASALRHVIGLLNTLMSYLLSAARAFATFMQTIFGKYKGGASGIMADMSGIAEDMDDAADSASKGLGGAAGSAGKIKKDLSVLPFDELNQLNKDSQSGGGGGGGGGAGGLGDVDFGDLMSLEEAFKSSAIADAISEWGERIRKAFKLKDWQKLGNEIAWGINQGIDKVYAIFDSGIIEEKVKPYISAFTQTLNSLTSSIHWQDMGRDIGAGITTIFNLLNELFKYNFHNLGTNFAFFLNGIVSETDFGSIGEFFGNKFMALWNYIDGLVSSFRWDNLGKKLAEGVKNLNSAVNLPVVGRSLATFVNGLFETLQNFVNNAPWEAIADNIASGIAEFIKTTDWIKNGQALGDFLLKLSETLRIIAETTPWDELGRGIADALSRVPWSAILVNVGRALITAFGGLLEGMMSQPEGAVAIGIIAGLNAISFAGKLAPLAGNIIAAIMGESAWKNAFGGGSGTGGGTPGGGGFLGSIAQNLLPTAAFLDTFKGLQNWNKQLNAYANKDKNASAEAEYAKTKGITWNDLEYSVMKSNLRNVGTTPVGKFLSEMKEQGLDASKAYGELVSEIQKEGWLGEASLKSFKKEFDKAVDPNEWRGSYTAEYKKFYKDIEKEADRTAKSHKQYGAQTTTSYADGEASKKQYLGEKTKQTQEYGRKKTMEILGISGGNSSVYKSLGEKSIFGAIEGWVSGTPEFVSKIGEMFGLVESEATNKVNGLSTAGKTVGSAFKNALLGGLGNPASEISNKFADTLKLINDNADVSKKSSLTYAGKELGVKLATGIQTGLGNPSANVATQANNVKDVLADNKRLNDLHTTAKTFGSKIASGVTAGMGTGQTAADTYASSYTEQNVKTTFYNAGKTLGGQLVAGIKGVSSTITPSITQKANDFVTKTVLKAITDGVSTHMTVKAPKYNVSFYKSGGLFMGGNGQVIGVAEGGRDEAVLPLENKKAMARIAGAITQSGGVGLDENKLADAIASRLVPYLGGNNSDRYISNEIYLDGDRIARSVSKAQRRNDLRYNPSPAY